ncbi:hypothetical protein PR048_015048 [Dryococelus australis]|uniref:Uncharacterized protein n=1 Tax=Dryococelus australis TaxID=614101 RepID=A0ABQ9HGU3_9NEOP|nr:hypothetical protein PR048_015048 [Dryococelus australis]
MLLVNHRLLTNFSGGGAANRDHFPTRSSQSFQSNWSANMHAHIRVTATALDFYRVSYSVMAVLVRDWLILRREKFHMEEECKQRHIRMEWSCAFKAKKRESDTGDTRTPSASSLLCARRAVFPAESASKWWSSKSTTSTAKPPTFDSEASHFDSEASHFDIDASHFDSETSPFDSETSHFDSEASHFNSEASHVNTETFHHIWAETFSINQENMQDHGRQAATQPTRPGVPVIYVRENPKSRTPRFIIRNPAEQQDNVNTRKGSRWHSGQSACQPGSIPGRVVPDFHKWKSCQTAGFLGDLLHAFRHYTIVGSQDLVWKCHIPTSSHGVSYTRGWPTATSPTRDTAIKQMTRCGTTRVFTVSRHCREPPALSIRVPNLQRTAAKRSCYETRAEIEARSSCSILARSCERPKSTQSLSYSGRGKRVIEVSTKQRRNERAGETGDPQETPQPAASSCTISTCENLGVTRPGIEPGSPYWEASRLTAQLPRLPLFETTAIYKGITFLAYSS